MLERRQKKNEEVLGREPSAARGCGPSPGEKERSAPAPFVISQKVGFQDFLKSGARRGGRELSGQRHRIKSS